MPLLGDLVLQTANNPGTGTFNLIAPPTGRVSWVTGCGVGAGRFYYAHDGTSWEVGDGTVTSGSPDTLSRDHVLRNSSGTTTRINFTSTVNVYSDVPADRGFWATSATTYDAQARTIQNLGNAGGGADALRYDQAGGIRLGYYAAGGGAFFIPLPASGLGGDLFQIDVFPFIITPATAVYFRISVDNFASVLAGPNEYGMGITFQGSVGGVATQHFNAISYAPISQTLTSIYGIHGSIEIMPAYRQWRSRFYGNSSTGGFTQDQATGYWNTLTAPTGVVIGAVNGNINTGAAARVIRRS